MSGQQLPMTHFSFNWSPGGYFVCALDRVLKEIGCWFVVGRARDGRSRGSRWILALCRNREILKSRSFIHFRCFFVRAFDGCTSLSLSVLLLPTCNSEPCQMQCINFYSYRVSAAAPSKQAPPLTRALLSFGPQKMDQLSCSRYYGVQMLLPYSVLYSKVYSIIYVACTIRSK